MCAVYEIDQVAYRVEAEDNCEEFQVEDAPTPVGVVSRLVGVYRICCGVLFEWLVMWGVPFAFRWG